MGEPAGCFEGAVGGGWDTILPSFFYNKSSSIQNVSHGLKDIQFYISFRRHGWPIGDKELGLSTREPGSIQASTTKINIFLFEKNKCIFAYTFFG